MRSRLWFGLASLLVGCVSSPRTLTIDVQTDLVAEYEMGSLAVDLVEGAAPAGSASAARTFRVAPRVAEAESYRRGRRVGEFDGLAPGTYTVRAVARRPPAPGLPIDGGEVLVERRVVVLVDGDRVVRVVLGADCAALGCPMPGDGDARTQCLNGRCVDPRCDPSRPDATGLCCTGRDCGTTALCEAPEDCTVAACATPDCVEGACIAAERLGACAAGAYCDRTLGTCVPVPGAPVDAGLPDAGVPDASTPDAGMPDALVTLDAFVAPSPDAAAPPPDAFRCPPEICGNGTDDDCDGRVDCRDTDCAGTRCDDGNACTHTDVCTGMATGPACAGTAIVCASTDCTTRTCNGTASCTETPRSGSCTDDGNVCTNDVCAGGVCTHPPVAGTVFCADDGNPCSFDLCDAGVCTHPRGFDGWACGVGGRCCNNTCVDVSSDPTNCGVCGIRCPGSCTGGVCPSASSSACIAAGYGSLASSFMGLCQCRCNLVETDRLTCTGQCAGGGTCDQRAGVNVCFYP
jgi:hypothetical protein